MQHYQSLYLSARPDTSIPTFAFLIIAIIIIPIFMIAHIRDQKLAENSYIQSVTLEYPSLVSKLSLLYSAGMTILSSLQKICCDYECSHPNSNSIVYSNLRHTINRINQGYSEADEYKLFGKKCKAACFLRFGNLLYRNLLKGSSDLEMVLRDEVNKAYELEKNNILKTSGEASTKLLLPMMMIFIVILILIMIPALNSVSLN